MPARAGRDRRATIMIRVIVKRLLVGVLVMWGAASLIFLIVRVAPGDPATIMLGPDASAEQVAQLNARLGLDRPMLSQYFHYLASAVRLDFGESYRLSTPAMSAVLERIPATAMLMLASTTIAVIVGLVLGLVAGGRPGSVTDRIVSASAIALQSFPTFWVGIMLILIFALALRLLPSAGAGTPAHLVLPAVTPGPAPARSWSTRSPTGTTRWCRRRPSSSPESSWFSTSWPICCTPSSTRVSGWTASHDA
jgi:peptide/nickel transport system permease protein